MHEGFVQCQQILKEIDERFLSVLYTESRIFYAIFHVQI